MVPPHLCVQVVMMSIENKFIGTTLVSISVLEITYQRVHTNQLDNSKYLQYKGKWYHYIILPNIFLLSYMKVRVIVRAFMHRIQH